MFTSQWEDVNPARAELYLETMDGNRTVRQSHVDYLGSQMKQGLWRRTHQGIAFDESNQLIDGQHRLWAIVESGCTVPLYVTRGVCREDVVVLDTGIVRGYADTAHYQGWETDPLTASVARILALGPGLRPKVPFDIQRQWYECYKDAIDFAITLRLQSRPSPGKSITAAMASAFAAAYFHCDHEMLTRFGGVLKTGQLEFEADRAAFTLRDAWLSGRLGSSAMDQYMKTEGAIRAFVDRRPIRNLQRPDAVIYHPPKLPPALRYKQSSKTTRTRRKEAPGRESTSVSA